MIELKETAWNHLSVYGQKETHGTFTSAERKWINKIEKLAKQYPNDVEITHKNPDGSIVAHIPIKWFKISPPRRISDETGRMMAERMRAGKSKP